MNDFIIENARPEDAAAILDYLKIVGRETDNLNMGAEGIPITVEVEEAFLRSMLDSSDDVMYAAKADGEIIGIANVSRLKRRMKRRRHGADGGAPCFRPEKRHRTAGA